MPSGSRPVHPQAVRRDPLNTLAGTLAGPRGPSPGRPGQARGCRAAAGSRAGVALTRGRVWPGRTPQPLGRSDDQGLGQGSTGMKDGADLEDGLHAGDDSSPGPVPDPRWSPHPVRRRRWLAKPAVVLARLLAGERVRVRVEPGLAVRARSPLTGAARRTCDNCPGSAGARTGGRLVRVPTPRTAAIRVPCAGGQ